MLNFDHLVLDDTTDPRSASGGRPRLAAQIAREIGARIMAEGWAVGHPLGREADLAVRAGVSRWTFREAVSLLEQNGLIASRRGGGGGLFVAGRMVDVLCTALSNYLDFVHVEPGELTLALVVADKLMIDALVAKPGDASRQRCAELIGETRDLHRSETFRATAALRTHLFESADNPALSLLAGTLSRLVIQSAWYSTLGDRTFRAVIDEMTVAIRNVAVALGDADLSAARAASQCYVRAAGELFESSATFGTLPRRSGSTDRAYRLYPPGEPQKKAERVARELRAIIVQSGWEVGMHLGTEAELMAQFAVGRPVLREALHSLEQMGVIAIGRGGASGVKVIAPDPSGLVRACRWFLRQENLSVSAASAVRDALVGVLPIDGSKNPVSKIEFFPIMEAILAPVTGLLSDSNMILMSESAK